MPWEVREFFTDTRWFRPDDWEQLADELTPELRHAAIDLRRLPHHERFEQTARDPELLEACTDIYADDTVDAVLGEDVMILLFLACLSDEHLDEIIRMFPCDPCEDTVRRDAGYLH